MFPFSELRFVTRFGYELKIIEAKLFVIVVKYRYQLIKQQRQLQAQQNQLLQSKSKPHHQSNNNRHHNGHEEKRQTIMQRPQGPKLIAKKLGPGYQMARMVGPQF